MFQLKYYGQFNLTKFFGNFRVCVRLYIRCRYYVYNEYSLRYYFRFYRMRCYVTTVVERKILQFLHKLAVREYFVYWFLKRTASLSGLIMARPTFYTYRRYNIIPTSSKNHIMVDVDTYRMFRTNLTILKAMIGQLNTQKMKRAGDMLFLKFHFYPNLLIILKIHRKKINDDENLKEYSGVCVV